jgi:hypothetical protein
VIAVEEQRALSEPADDRWVPIRCDKNRRTIDVNHARRQVRYSCERCHRVHVVQIGDGSEKPACVRYN